jgi:D-alanyl-D-alanine carboxypeptidase
MKTHALLSSFRKAAIVAAVCVCAALPAWAGKYASIVIDLDTAQVLHARDADDTRYPASLTKVMTLYLVFDALDAGKLKLTDQLSVSRAASHQQPSKLGLKAGNSIKVEDAIRALVTKSANDVAVVLAEKLGGGSEAKFVVKMNAKAAELGLEHTNFRNASGLPDRRQTTTARDMAKLAEAVFMDHRDRYNYFSTPDFVWNKRKYANHNELLRRVDGVDGIKTGYTNASGYNLMASAERNGHRVIAVMLGGTTGKSRDQHVADLLEAAFLQISGAPENAYADLRARIALGERGEMDANALAMLQLRKFSDPDGGTEIADASADEGGTDESEDDDGVEFAQGDAEPPAEAAGVPAAAGVLASVAPAPVPAAVVVPAAVEVAAPAHTAEAVIVTSELPLKPTPGAAAAGLQ